MAQHQGTPAIRKRKIDEVCDDKESLLLQVVPEAKQVKLPQIPRHPLVEVDENNCFWGSVNGQQCLLMLDSGTTMPVLYLPLALKLGLVTGDEEKETVNFDMWSG